jgi:predicted sugar kinase
MNLLREAKLEFVGMSSVGPSIAVVTDKDRKSVEKILKPIGLTIAIVTKADNQGLEVVHTV